MNVILLPPNNHNENIMREFAKEKGFRLRKVRGELLYDLIDPDSGEKILSREHLVFIHDYLCNHD